MGRAHRHAVRPRRGGIAWHTQLRASLKLESPTGGGAVFVGRPKKNTGEHIMWTLLLLSLAFLSVAPTAHAALTGATVVLDQIYPSADNVALQIGSATVGPGIEFSAAIADYDWDIASNGVVSFSHTFSCNTSPCSLSYTPSSFNGFRLSFPDLNRSITGIDLLSTDGFASFGVDRLTSFGSDVFVSLGGIDESFRSGTLFGASFRIHATPEPGTFALLSFGLAGLGLRSLRKAV